jgi:hypothetical protein
MICYKKVVVLERQSLEFTRSQVMTMYFILFIYFYFAVLPLNSFAENTAFRLLHCCHEMQRY